MISMTWPEYQRQQCRVGAFVIQLTFLETELLSTLLIRYPEPVTLAELIEIAFPDPDLEPQNAETAVSDRMRNLARKIGAFRIKNNGRYRGYWLCQRPEDMKAAA
jgi:hypothetical protein